PCIPCFYLFSRGLIACERPSSFHGPPCRWTPCYSGGMAASRVSAAPARNRDARERIDASPSAPGSAGRDADIHHRAAGGAEVVEAGVVDHGLARAPGAVGLEAVARGMAAFGGGRRAAFLGAARREPAAARVGVAEIGVRVAAAGLGGRLASLGHGDLPDDADIARHAIRLDLLKPTGRAHLVLAEARIAPGSRLLLAGGAA